MSEQPVGLDGEGQAPQAAGGRRGQAAPAWASGADRTRRARGRWRPSPPGPPPLPAPAESSDSALPDSSDARASCASLRAGTTARCQSDSAARRFFATRSSSTTNPMATTSKTIEGDQAPGGVGRGRRGGVVVVVVGRWWSSWSWRVVGSSRWSCVGRGRGREVDVVVAGDAERGGGVPGTVVVVLVTGDHGPRAAGPAAMPWPLDPARPSPRPPGRPMAALAATFRTGGPRGYRLMPPARRPGPRCAAAWPGSSDPRRRDGG